MWNFTETETHCYQGVPNTHYFMKIPLYSVMYPEVFQAYCYLHKNVLRETAVQLAALW